MKTTSLPVSDMAGQPIEGSQALVWGNNAAWLCTECGRLLGNRTADGECEVRCPCGAGYEILRAPNKNGNLNLGPATGVRRRPLPTDDAAG